MYLQLLGAPHPDTLSSGSKRSAPTNGYQNKRPKTTTSSVAYAQQRPNSGPYVPVNGGYGVAGPASNRPPPQEGDSSLMKSFTVAEIEAHLESLNESLHLTSTKIGEKCRSMINKLLNDTYADPFKLPVDPVALKLPDYFDVVKEPMDLGTVKKKVRGRSSPKCLLKSWKRRSTSANNVCVFVHRSTRAATPTSNRSKRTSASSSPTACSTTARGQT